MTLRKAEDFGVSGTCVRWRNPREVRVHHEEVDVVAVVCDGLAGPTVVVVELALCREADLNGCVDRFHRGLCRTVAILAGRASSDSIKEFGRFAGPRDLPAVVGTLVGARQPAVGFVAELP